MTANILRQYLIELGVPHTNQYIEDCCRKQPYRDSLFSISELLDLYNVKNVVVRFKDKDALFHTHCPMLVSLQWQYVIVTHIVDDVVEIVNAQGKRQELSMDLFLRNWDGVAIISEADSNSIEPNLRQNVKRTRIANIKKIGAIIGLIIVMAYGFLANLCAQGIWMTTLFIINCVGLYLSFLLVQEELNIPNKVTEKLCGIVKNSDCRQVANSEGSMIFGIVKLSYVGFSFFCVNIACLLFAPGLVSALAVYAIGVLPFSLWSIWYQKFRVKSWCTLCLCTLVIMWSQAIIYACFVKWNTIFDGWYMLMIVGAIYLLVVLFTEYVVEHLKDRQQKYMWEYNFTHLKSQPEVVNALMSKQPIVDTSEQGCSSLLFGNPKANTRITVFSNPYCNTCGMIHQIVKTYPGQDVCVQYVLTYFSLERSRINKFIISAYFKLGAEKTWKLLSQWYDNGKAQGESFFKEMNLNISDPNVESEFNKHLDWSARTRFQGTPTIIINGRELTGPYTVEDYRLFNDL